MCSIVGNGYNQYHHGWKFFPQMDQIKQLLYYSTSRNDALMNFACHQGCNVVVGYVDKHMEESI
jgi:hypothetical protein